MHIPISEDRLIIAIKLLRVAKSMIDARCAAADALNMIPHTGEPSSGLFGLDDVILEVLGIDLDEEEQMDWCLNNRLTSILLRKKPSQYRSAILALLRERMAHNG